MTCNGTINLKENQIMKSMRKTLVGLVMALVLVFALSVSCFAANPPGVVNVIASGTNSDVTVTTVAPYVQDTLALTTTGTFNVQQSNRFVESAAWAGDGNDIDRTASFTGCGTVSTVSNYLSTDAWSVAAANIKASVTASGVGALGEIDQNLHFDQNVGGVVSQDQWKKQRSMDIYAGGTYLLDVSNVGASLAPSLGSMPSGSLPAYSLDINASATSGNVGLHFDNTLSTTGYQALSNNADHSQYTGLSTNFALAYTGAPVVNVTAQTVTSGNITIISNFVNSTVSGYGTIK